MRLWPLAPRSRTLAALVALGLGLRALALAASTGGAEQQQAERNAPVPSAVARAERTERAALCPAGTLPDGGVCVPVLPTTAGGEALAEERASHHDRQGRLRSYDQIPRRPERPADYRRYRLPVPPLPDASFVTSGYDLDRPDAEQRRGSELSAVGHGGVDLAQRRGTPVSLVPLEHQVGEASVLFAGKLFGNSVVTHHAVREGGALRDYLVIHGHLERPATGLSRGASLAAGATLGFVGDSGSPGVVHLHLEVRRAREGVALTELAPGELAHNAKTVACDPRNVLPLLP